MKKNFYKKKIYIAGHRGMVGTSVTNFLKKKGFRNLITIKRNDLDLENYDLVNKFVKKKKTGCNYKLCRTSRRYNGKLKISN